MGRVLCLESAFENDPTAKEGARARKVGGFNGLFGKMGAFRRITQMYASIPRQRQKLSYQGG